jgi:hypothetical protein
MVQARVRLLITLCVYVGIYANEYFFSRIICGERERERELTCIESYFM